MFSLGSQQDIYSLSKYREYRKSQLRKLFQHFKTETDESLFNILTQSDHTIRPFIGALIHNELMPIFGQRDQEMDVYACDLLYLYCRYPQIRDYLEHGFGFQKVRWRTNKKYMKQYRCWIKRWQYEYKHNEIHRLNLLRPTFNVRLTQNILFVTTK